jgi:hypothetical protein
MGQLRDLAGKRRKAMRAESSWQPDSGHRLQVQAALPRLHLHSRGIEARCCRTKLISKSVARIYFSACWEFCQLDKKLGIRVDIENGCAHAGG